MWRSENGGKSWRRLTKGFPKKHGYFTILRDAMDFDHLKTPGVYFGTTTGQLWLGREGGEQCCPSLGAHGQIFGNAEYRDLPRGRTSILARQGESNRERV